MANKGPLPYHRATLAVTGSIPDLDESRVTEIAASITKLLRAELQDSDRHPDRIHEALNALACVAGVLIESAGPTARASFEDALRRQIAELVR